MDDFTDEILDPETAYLIRHASAGDPQVAYHSPFAAARGRFDRTAALDNGMASGASRVGGASAAPGSASAAPPSLQIPEGTLAAIMQGIAELHAAGDLQGALGAAHLLGSLGVDWLPELTGSGILNAGPSERGANGEGIRMPTASDFSAGFGDGGFGDLFDKRSLVSQDGGGDAWQEGHGVEPDSPFSYFLGAYQGTPGEDAFDRMFMYGGDHDGSDAMRFMTPSIVEPRSSSGDSTPSQELVPKTNWEPWKPPVQIIGSDDETTSRDTLKPMGTLWQPPPNPFEDASDAKPPGPSTTPVGPPNRADPDDTGGGSVDPDAARVSAAARTLINMVPLIRWSVQLANRKPPSGHGGDPWREDGGSSRAYGGRSRVASLEPSFVDAPAHAAANPAVLAAFWRQVRAHAAGGFGPGKRPTALAAAIAAEGVPLVGSKVTL